MQEGDQLLTMQDRTSSYVARILPLYFGRDITYLLLSDNKYLADRLKVKVKRLHRAAGFIRKADKLNIGLMDGAAEVTVLVSAETCDLGPCFDVVVGEIDRLTTQILVVIGDPDKFVLSDQIHSKVVEHGFVFSNTLTKSLNIIFKDKGVEAMVFGKITWVQVHPTLF